MLTVADVYQYIDSLAPFETQLDFDNAGLLTGRMTQEVTGIHVALDCTAGVIQEAEKLGARFLYNLHPDEGISSSLKIGLRVNREMDACLFTVADQPWLRWETVFGLVDVFLRDGKGIACVEHDGKTGNPCVFSKKYYGELMELSGDVGGKRVVVAHRGDVAVMKVEDGREMVDVDFADGRR